MSDFLDEATGKAFEFEFVKQEASTMFVEIQLALLDYSKDFETGNYSKQEERQAREGVSVLSGSVARVLGPRTLADIGASKTIERPTHYWELYLARELASYAEADCLPLTLCLVPESLWTDIARALGKYLEPEDAQALSKLGTLNSRARTNRPTNLPPEDQPPEQPF